MIFLQSCLGADGQVQAVDSGMVSSFIAGQAYVRGNPLVSAAALAATDNFIGGFRYSSAGALMIFDASAGAPAVNFSNAGMMVNANGQLCVIIDDVAAGGSTVNGVAVSADGRPYIAVTSPPDNPVANFTGDPLSGSAPLTVDFTDASADSPASWLWEKNDGGGWANFDGTPTAQNPTEDLAEGTWSIRLTATNAGGSDTKTRTDYIEVSAAPSYTGPLDLVPGAVVAYGQRAMSAAKLGTALYTLREDAGNTTQSFNSDAVTGAAPVASITAFLNGANGLITKWNDQSGNGSDVLQAVGSQQPKWLPAQFGSVPAISFSAPSSQYLFSAGNVTLANGSYTVFVVFSSSSFSYYPFAGMNYQQFSGPGQVCSFRIDSTDLFMDASSDGMNTNEVNAHADTNLDDPAAGIADMTCANGVHSFVFNGTDQGATAIVDSGVVGSLTQPLAVGADDADISGGLGTFGGRIAELIIYDSILSSGDRLAIRQNIAAYYGITLS